MIIKNIKETLIRLHPESQPYAKFLVEHGDKAHIFDNPTRAACFLGQIHTESNGFTATAESFNYSVPGLLTTFSYKRISSGQCAALGRSSRIKADQEAIANIVYGGEFGLKQLGNTENGDGWKFRGRGLKQITGRANYAQFSLDHLGDLSLLDSPGRLMEPELAAASAVWFWDAHDINSLGDVRDIKRITKVVNGGYNGLKQRISWTEHYESILTA